MKVEKLVLGLVAVTMMAMVLVTADATAQIFGRRVVQRQQQPVCNGPECQQQLAAESVVLQSEFLSQFPGPVQSVTLPANPVPVQMSDVLPEGISQASKAVADGPHCRCIVNGSCGSGTICGADSSGAYVVSNAHVWGTQIGKTVNVDIVSEGATKRLQGRIVFSGYSNSRMVDFAIAKVEGLTSKTYMPMVKTEPADGPYGTRGSPKCVWPQVTKAFNDPRNYGQGLITGSPDAIGGQSGSAIYNSKGQQIALLTWSINGRCAGQKTSLLWQVATQRNVMLADERPTDLMELAYGPRPETIEGIHGDCPRVVSGRPETVEGIHGAIEVSDNKFRPITENVIASQASMQDLPIWFDPTDPPADPVDPPAGDCHKLTDKEWELIQFLRKQNEEAGFGDRIKDRDWATLILKWLPLILELIKDIQENRK
jgi:hypothetical protein